MGKKTSKIEGLKLAKDEAAEELRLSMLMGCELAQAMRELSVALNRCRAALQRGELRDKIKALQLQHTEHTEAEKKLHERQYRTAVDYSQAHRRLTEAERVLRVIKNPPPWGLGGDWTKAQIAAFEKQAREVVKELS